MMMVEINNEKTLRGLIIANITALVSGLVVVVWLFSGFTHTQSQILENVEALQAEQNGQWQRINNLEQSNQALVDEILELQRLHPRSNDGDNLSSPGSTSRTVAWLRSLPTDEVER